MHWAELYEYQRQLDKYIEQHKNVEKESVVDHKTLAFYVELGELANETRCFKFWSNKSESDHETIREEYVDGLHFLLSLGIELNSYVESAEISDVTSRTEAFLTVYQRLGEWKREKTKQTYQNLFDAYVTLAAALNISEEDMKQAYLEKNDENYDRQDRGY
ncbi:dUTP diphosphatase [Salimicrobium jeotgali]|uniref:dUTP diphosphatase n=1 Tax=Salimicrobium jeotgali TaxID=1230341 RepID=UPI000C82ABE3|nr:dUTP diphosphatase [Salimicrobium jeotgali]